MGALRTLGSTGRPRNRNVLHAAWDQRRGGGRGSVILSLWNLSTCQALGLTVGLKVLLTWEARTVLITRREVSCGWQLTGASAGGCAKRAHSLREREWI